MAGPHPSVVTSIHIHHLCQGGCVQIVLCLIHNLQLHAHLLPLYHPPQDMQQSPGLPARSPSANFLEFMRNINDPGWHFDPEGARLKVPKGMLSAQKMASMLPPVAVEKCIEDLELHSWVPTMPDLHVFQTFPKLQALTIGNDYGTELGDVSIQRICTSLPSTVLCCCEDSCKHFFTYALMHSQGCGASSFLQVTKTLQAWACLTLASIYSSLRPSQLPLLLKENVVLPQQKH